MHFQKLNLLRVVPLEPISTNAATICLRNITFHGILSALKNLTSTGLTISEHLYLSKGFKLYTRGTNQQIACLFLSPLFYTCFHKRHFKENMSMLRPGTWLTIHCIWAWLRNSAASLLRTCLSLTAHLQWLFTPFQDSPGPILLYIAFTETLIYTVFYTQCKVIMMEAPLLSGVSNMQ